MRLNDIGIRRGLPKPSHAAALWRLTTRLCERLETKTCGYTTIQMLFLHELKIVKSTP